MNFYEIRNRGKKVSLPLLWLTKNFDNVKVIDGCRQVFKIEEIYDGEIIVAHITQIWRQYAEFHQLKDSDFYYRIRKV